MTRADDDARDSFEPDEHPTKPPARAGSSTSRWRTVASAALQRGFGRLSEGDFDQGPDLEVEWDPGSSPAVAREALVDPVPNDGVHVAPRPDLGPRGTLRIPLRPKVVQPTLRMKAPPRSSIATIRIPRPRPTWPRIPVLVFLGLLAGAALGTGLGTRAGESAAAPPPAASSETNSTPPLETPPAYPVLPSEPAPVQAVSPAVETSPPPTIPARARPRPTTSPRRASSKASVF
jgi:hypothetical protein